MGKYSVEEVITGISFIAVFSVLQFQFEKINGNPVPTIIFKGRPFFFHLFLLGLNFAFFGGVATAFLKQLHPKIADFFRLISLLSITVAAGVFTSLASPWALRAALFDQAASLVATA